MPLRPSRMVLRVFFAVVPLLAMTGCRSTPPPKPLDQLSPQEAAGRADFASYCGTCHYDRQSGSLHGPSLLGVYKKQYLPSGAPANDDRIRTTMLQGRNNMPAVGRSMTDGQIEDTLAYLKTL